MKRVAAAAAATVLLAGCGAGGVSITLAPTPPLYSPPASTPTPAAATTAPSGPTLPPSEVSPPFATTGDAHNFAAQQGAAAHFAALATSESQCISGTTCYVESATPAYGTNGAYYVDKVISDSSDSVDVVYLYRDPAAGQWHWLDSLNAQAAYPARNQTVQVQIDRGCANVRTQTVFTSGTVTCLSNGSTVTIDDGPAWASGHLWWHLSDHGGWIIHDSLISGFAPLAQN